MSRTTATICKFIGTISLGLLTGVSYTTTITALPPLTTLPTAQPASTTFQHLRSLTSRHCSLLATLSGTSLLLSYALSPRRGRHPYLLWAALAVGLGYAEEGYAVVMMKKKKGKGGSGRGGKVGEGAGVGGARTPDSSDEEWEVEGRDGRDGDASGSGSGGVLNGEAVREGMEKWRGKMVGRMAVWGVGWLVTVIGLWGDGV